VLLPECLIALILIRRKGKAYGTTVFGRTGKAVHQDNDIKTVDDVQVALRDLFGKTLQTMLEAEMDNHLGYQKHDDKNKKTSNRRNGHGKKSVRSGYGEVELEVPRDRDGEFEPLLVGKRQKNVTGIEDQILALYAKGVSTRDI
jgi:transposase-like protein